MNRRTIALLAVVLPLAACASDLSKGNQEEKRQQQAATDAIVAAQPLPVRPYSQYRQTLIDVEVAQMDAIQTTTFFFNQGVVDPIMSCPSVGFAVPNTASLSNPEQVIYTGGNGAVATGGQMDPNGVYMPTSSTGTYATCVDKNGAGYYVYWEGFVQTVTGPAQWDREKHEVILTGAPTATVTKK